MSNRQDTPISVTGLRGRDGSTASTLAIPPQKALEMQNVDLYRSQFAHKRNGASTVFNLTTGEVFTGVMSSLIRYVPGADPTAAALWAVDNAATPVIQYLAGGTVWATPTMKDNIAGNPQDVVGATLNGKLFLAFDSTADRLHVWDPVDAAQTSGITVRRTGLATPAAVTVANTGSGTYAATTRYYVTCYAVFDGATEMRLSELSSAVSFTPSGSGTAARITKPAAINENETHWIVFGSLDGDLYEKLDEIAVATTTYDDSDNPADYTGDAPPTVGTHTNWTSVRYLLSTGNQLLGAGSWESGGKNNRVWYSAFIGQTGVGDAESVPQTAVVSNYVDLDENDGGVITGLGGPLDGRPLVFKRNQVWRLIPTGLDNPVYQPRSLFIGSGIGCLRHQTIVNAEDQSGAPAVYWLSETGPYRLGADGPQSMVDDIQDLWDTINLAATTVVAHGVYHRDLRQIWWWIATGSSNDPDTKIVFDVKLGRVYEGGRMQDGWVKHTGLSAAARCSVMFSNTLAASMSRDVKPYIGYTTGSVLMKCDSTATDDIGTTFQAYVDLPDRHYAGLDKRCVLGKPIILGSAGSQNLQVTYTADYGAVTGRSASVSMAASGSETRALRVVEGVEYGDAASSVKVRVGDSAASAATWTIDAIVIPVERAEDISQ